MDNTIKRRFFIRGAAAFVTAMGLKKIEASERIYEDPLDKTFFINPAYTVDSIAAGNTILRTHLAGGKMKELTFSGFENDIIAIVKRNSSIRPNLTNLASLHHLGENECRDKSNAVLDRLIGEGIIVTIDTKMNIIQNVIKRPSE